MSLGHIKGTTGKEVQEEEEEQERGRERGDQNNGLAICPPHMLYLYETVKNKLQIGLRLAYLLLIPISNGPPDQGKKYDSIWNIAPCVSYLLRKRALYNDMSRYVCCAGYLPCSGRCGESRCPELCLCTEVFLCFPNSVASTRFLLQDEFNIQTTQCDNCIIGFMFCLQQIACIFSIVAMCVGGGELQDAAQILNCFSNAVYLTVCACMQTQHKVEMDKRDGKFGPPPVMAVPPPQQMSRFDQPVPPPAGYLPQPGYGQPYAYPPPPAQGYTAAAAAYPPPGYSSSGYPK
ncbi:hypothetical protein Taro_021901 [Colocasia esculenta]|uniref:PLAC8 family protein n=1 Tax=Colocasia esculenta TaxID=4460 RepID=A0A843V071_COLES|nr:hypothetical protein [Colocasia esculenta]